MTLIRGPRSTMCTIRQAETGDSVRISMYFDGTGNNRANAKRGYELRADHESTGTELYSGSYDNDYSNVSRLEELQDAHEGYDYSFKFYVEGIGTRNLGNDSPAGTITGRGDDTSVTAKVGSGIRHMLRGIENEVTSRRISHVHLDAFGFSRGAAAARHFVYKMMREEGHTLLDQLRRRGFTVGSVAVKFVGLFDTVASYGVAHYDDTRELHLDAITAADYVVQLAAGDEHRENFRLTNIRSAKRQNKGLEIFLPGVHSDIGGGYRNGQPESLQIYDHDSFGWNSAEQTQSLVFEREWLLQMGWYAAREIGEPTDNNEINVHRTSISNRYTFIPMHLMARYATQYGCRYPTLDLRSGSGYGATTTPSRYRVPTGLDRAKQEIEIYINTIVAGGTDSEVDWINNDADWLKTVRHDYFHFSAHYGDVGRAPQWRRLTTAAGVAKTFLLMQWTAAVLKVKPALIVDADPTDGYRLRIVQNG